MIVPQIVLAAIVFLYGFGCFYSYRYYRDLDEDFDRKAVRWLGLGLAAQLLLLAGRWIANGYPPLDSLEAILTAFSLSLSASLLMGRIKTALPVLTSLFAPFLFLIVFVAALLTFFQGLPLKDSPLMSTAMASHILLTFLGFSHFTLGFGVGVAYWIQEGQLKQHRIRNWSYRLPALEDLDRLTVFHIGMGSLFWVCGLGLGTVQAFELWNKLPLGDPKILGSFLVLMIYACFFLLRWFFEMRGRKSMILVMAGYILALFTFVGVQVFLTTRHAF